MSAPVPPLVAAASVSLDCKEGDEPLLSERYASKTDDVIVTDEREVKELVPIALNNGPRDMWRA